MKRIHQIILIGSFIPLCWLLMMIVHEAGHVFAAWLTDGTVTKVVLHPFAISRTDVMPNPEPLIVVWAGPLFGVLSPLLFWAFLHLARIPHAYLVRFFAGFCLIANGAYLGFGSFNGIGDAGIIMKHGTPIWGLWIFAGITVPAGFMLWHQLGIHFGLGKSQGKVNSAAAYVSLSLLVITLILTFSLSPQV